ncbi:MAG TPA: VOC family protein [Stellaceae bacterium]|nr:VOC family protein [Stellaceae bacterium]
MTSSAERPSRGIDHVVILVRDLDAAEAQYRRMGFNLTPRGHHSRLKSFNHCAMLAGGDYLELLTTGERGARPYYDEFLERREGVSGIAFRTADALATRAALAAAKFRPEEPVAFGRPVTIDGGEREARFVTVTVDPAIPLGARTFFCQHRTPELVWQPSYLPQPNGARALAVVTWVAEGPDLAQHYTRLLGGTAAREAEAATIGLGAHRLDFISPAAAAARFPGDPVLRLAPPYIACIRVSVADPAAAERLLRGAGVPFRRTETGGLQVPSTAAAGAVLEFG